MPGPWLRLCYSRLDYIVSTMSLITLEVFIIFYLKIKKIKSHSLVTMGRTQLFPFIVQVSWETELLVDRYDICTQKMVLKGHLAVTLGMMEL